MLVAGLGPVHLRRSRARKCPSTYILFSMLNNSTLESAFRQIDDQLCQWGPAALDVGSPTDRNRAVEATMRVSLDVLNRHFPEGEQRFLELGNHKDSVIDRVILEKDWNLSAWEASKLCRQLSELSEE